MRKDTVKSLERYFSILEDETPARFRLCRKIPLEGDLSSEEEGLWEMHFERLEKLEELTEKINQDGIKIDEIENPPKSLLDLKLELADRIIESGHLCEHRCGINRLEGEKGRCGVGSVPKISSDFIHRGEDPELVLSYTVFFSGCTLECQFCQNWDIS